jgi:hypothetical protein
MAGFGINCTKLLVLPQKGWLRISGTCSPCGRRVILQGVAKFYASEERNTVYIHQHQMLTLFAVN